MATCAACHDPLVVEVEFEDEDEDMETTETGESSAAGGSSSTKQTVPDDVHLNCGCHFHWYVERAINSLLTDPLVADGNA